MKLVGEVQGAVFSGNVAFEKPRMIKIAKGYKDGVQEFRDVASFDNLADRVILSRVTVYVRDVLEGVLGDCCYSFRRDSERSHQLAIERLQKWREEHAVARDARPYRATQMFVAECDIKKFFDNISHDVVRRCWEKMGFDAAAGRALEAYLAVYAANGAAGVRALPDGAVGSPRPTGTRRGLPQGGSLSTVRIKFSVRVNGFELPKLPVLPVAMNFNPNGGTGWLPTDAEFAERTAAAKDPAAPRNIWKKRKMEWVDFLADYLITYDFLYRVSRAPRDPVPDWEALMRLKGQGRLGPFNLAYWGKRGAGEKAMKDWQEKSLPYYKKICDRAKELGILDKGFFYGNDECNPDTFDAIRRQADLIHKEFPGVPLFTTARDKDFGIGTNSLANVEWFCPLTGRYDYKRAEKARATGRKIWWYVCDGPTWNCANLHIENKPIDARSMLGAQSLFYKADGFLYWQVGKWHSPRTIGENPFTDWVAASCFGFNGEGCIAGVGPDGIPLPTVRLENFRDGLEDYAYVQLLKEKLHEVENGKCKMENAERLRRAKELVAVPPSLVKALDCFSDDPAVLYAWRDGIADCLDE